MRKILKEDEVVVLAGKDKGKRGTVIECIGIGRVIIHGINISKKAVKPNPSAGSAGGLVDKVMPIHISNVALFNAETGKKDRATFQERDGKKVRVYKSSGSAIRT